MCSNHGALRAGPSDNVLQTRGPRNQLELITSATCRIGPIGVRTRRRREVATVITNNTTTEILQLLLKRGLSGKGIEWEMHYGKLLVLQHPALQPPFFLTMYNSRERFIQDIGLIKYLIFRTVYCLKGEATSRTGVGVAKA